MNSNRKKGFRQAIALAVTVFAIGGGIVLASPASANEEPVVEETAQIEETTAPVDEPIVETPAEPVVEEPVVPPVVEEEPVLSAPTSETKTLRWTLPEGGTWPQAVFDPASIPCGTTVRVQVDTYPYTTAEDKARTDALDDDGFLREGEDYGWAQSWFFENYTAEDCYVPPTAANPNATITAVCGAATATFTNPLVKDANQLTASFVVNVDDVYNNAYAVEAGATVAEDYEFAEDTGDHVIEVYQAGTSEWKLIQSATVTSDCIEPPVVVPPTEEPPTTVPPVDEPKTPVSRAAVATETTDLAETGGAVNPWLLGGGAALLLMGLAISGIAARATRR